MGGQGGAEEETKKSKHNGSFELSENDNCAFRDATGQWLSAARLQKAPVGSGRRRYVVS